MKTFSDLALCIVLILWSISALVAIFAPLVLDLLTWRKFSLKTRMFAGKWLKISGFCIPSYNHGSIGDRSLRTYSARSSRSRCIPVNAWVLRVLEPVSARQGRKDPRSVRGRSSRAATARFKRRAVSVSTFHTTKRAVTITAPCTRSL
jgi:hypothetical protein